MINAEEVVKLDSIFEEPADDESKVYMMIRGTAGLPGYYHYIIGHKHSDPDMVEHHQQSSFYLRLPEYSYSLAEGLWNYYKDIIKEYAKNADYYGDFNFIFSDSVSYNNIALAYSGLTTTMFNMSNAKEYYGVKQTFIKDFIKNNNDKKYIQADIAELLLYYSDFYSDFSEDSFKEKTQKRAIEHAEKYPTGKNYYNDDKYALVMYCSPTISNFNRDEIKYARLNNVELLHLPEDKRYIFNLCYNSFVAYCSYLKNDDSVMYHDYKIKDYPVEKFINDDVFITENIKYDFLARELDDSFFKDYKTDDELHQIVDYFSNLTVKEYDKITQLFIIDDLLRKKDSQVKYRQPTHALKDLTKLYNYSDIILNNKYDDIIIDDALIDKFLRLKPRNINNKDALSSIRTYIRESRSFVLLKPVISIILETFENTKLTDSIINDLYNLINPESKWINNYYDVSFIVYQFSEIMSNRELLNLINDADNNEINLSEEQWLEFIKNYTTYKNMPVSWWRELI